ncbi:MAG: Gldg family protein [Bacteroidetes bacterium]|nr:Gldg family protein [Bacteroidota bacterium]
MNKNVTISAALIIAIIVAANLFSHEFHFRLDLTEDREYTLSKATLDIIDDLEDAITIKAYFSENLPPQYAPVSQGFQETLLEYADRSEGKIVYEFINPNASDAQEEEAVKAGVQPLMINVREKDQMKQQKAYMGAVISLGEKTEVIPFIQPGSATEFALSKAIKKLSVTDKPVIGFLQGHGEAPLGELIEVRENLDVLFTAQEVSLSDSTSIGSEISTLAIVRPTDSIPAAHLSKIDEFLSRGGRLLVAMNRVDGDLQNASGKSLNTGLEAWLQNKGLEVEDNFVLDAQCAAITYQQQTNFGIIAQQLQFPYLPVISAFLDHPITGGLETVVMQFASTIRYTGDTTKRFIPIAFTSEKSSTQKSPVFFDPAKEWTEEDFTQQNLPVAAVLEGKLGSSASAKSTMVVIADGDFPVNGPAQQARRVQPDNINLFVNAVEFLSDDTGLIELRTKGSSSRPIRQLDDSLKATLKYLNFLLPVLLAIGYGLYRMQRNKNIQLKRMSENFDA